MSDVNIIHEINYKYYFYKRYIILVKLTIVDLLEQRMCYLQKVLVIIDFM